MNYRELYGNKTFHRKLEMEYPLIEWREPFYVSRIDAPGQRRLGCRFCIAASGLKASKIGTSPYCFADLEDFGEHMESAHPM